MNATHVAFGSQTTETEAAKMKPTEITSQPTQVIGGAVKQVVKLSDADMRYLETNEKIVATARDTLIQIAEALYRIKTYKGGILWKNDYDSFEDYGKERWGYKKTQAYRLIETGGFLCELDQDNSAYGESGGQSVKKPRNEIQVRALGPVPKELRVDCWKSIVTHRDPEELTSKDVDAEVTVYMNRKKLQSTKPKVVRPTAVARATKKIVELETVLNKFADPKSVEPLIQQLMTLVNSEESNEGDHAGTENCRTSIAQPAAADTKTDAVLAEDPAIEVGSTPSSLVTV